jgi:hypothetical protein
MSARGVSTVLDATLCLLLVSAAVVTLVTVPGTEARPANTPGDTRSAAGTLAASTAAVERANGTANATVANLLADAALLNAAGESTPTFAAGVRNATNRTLAGTRGRTAADAVARNGSRPVGRFHVGPTPPEGTAVEASSFTVPAPESPRAVRVRIVVRGWSA